MLSVLRLKCCLAIITVRAREAVRSECAGHCILRRTGPGVKADYQSIDSHQLSSLLITSQRYLSNNCWDGPSAQTVRPLTVREDRAREVEGRLEEVGGLVNIVLVSLDSRLTEIPCSVTELRLGNTVHG